jgi:hypothetical protein
MMTEYDKEKVGEILRGHGSWYTAKLMRLICTCDAPNKKQMHKAYPEVVDVVHKFQTGKTLTEEMNESNG